MELLDTSAIYKEPRILKIELKGAVLNSPTDPIYLNY